MSKICLLLTVFSLAGCVSRPAQIEPEAPHVAHKVTCDDDPWVPPSAAKELGPTGDPRLYFSVPPYVTDGVRRKDADSVGHKGLFQKTVNRLEKLASCGPQHVKTFNAGLTAWFDWTSPTALKPNFALAQYKPHDPDDGVGIIEVRDVARVIAAAKKIGGGTLGFKLWLHELDVWLRDSPSGKNEAKRDNNHATFYYATRLELIRATRPPEAARKDAVPIAAALQELLEAQFEKDGSQPKELKRTRPLHYSLFNLEAWTSAVWSLEAIGLKDETTPFRAKIAMGLTYVRDQKRFASLERIDRVVHDGPKRGANDFTGRLSALQRQLNGGH